MKEQQNVSPTEQAHRDLRNILLNGRILINGMPLTGNELGVIIQGEQMLYGKAIQIDKTSAEKVAKIGKPKNPEKTPKIIPLKQPEEK